MRLRTSFLLPLAAVSLIAGCGETTIDSGKAEDFIKKAVTEQVGATVKSVDCPGDVKAKKGDTFDCVVTGTDGTKGNAVVTQKDADGNVNVSAPFIHRDEIEQTLGAQFSTQYKTKITLDCPEIILPKAGGTFECQASDSTGEKRTVDVTQTDAKGNVTAKVRSS